MILYISNWYPHLDHLQRFLFEYCKHNGLTTFVIDDFPRLVYKQAVIVIITSHQIYKL